MYKQFSKNDKAFTGLEAAIVLIAFVVVAAVFSYVMLGAGFYTTQKSQEVVHTGVQQASSSLISSGETIVASDSDGDNASEVYFYLANTAGGSSVDLNKTLITYTDSDDFVTHSLTNNNSTSDFWAYERVIKSGDAYNLVEQGEKYKITVNLSNGGSSWNSLPSVNEQIKIEVKPPEGAVLAMERRMPPSLTKDSYYSVY
ncbi:archaellin/type IV pilin N-terminal domain-containing protein [Methanohalophilus sp. DAL1]|jgi:flagellin FlaB|uniref:archaellin/type IV pilin N-terminal domain-containing protein n=1 Tax=Methanohalophilus sp. DAL1 TaxID=1864608 RepID=UPI000817377A|nr:archaellin/type IV pilin N-terminal domain-containing protein [Methanohalophilus sp. DAL1]OBZ35491.1 MAG: flagellin [Methanohalophilus sp. DAL1]